MTEQVDLLVRGTIVDVTAGTLTDGAIAVDDGEIVAREPRPAATTLEAGYVTPGLIDAHTHIEASMVTIPQFGDAVVPHGVTSVLHDPHEIANVLGPTGVRQFSADADRTPLKPRLTVPSSVPASRLQSAGATVEADDVAALLDTQRAVALGEVMDHRAVLEGEEEVHAKIAAARDRGLPVDGHLPGVAGPELQDLAEYLDTDHESVTLAEAHAKAEAGLRVYLREGSTSKNLDALVDIVETVDTSRLSLCSDDRSVVDIVERGGVNEAVEKAIALGVDPVTAVQMATVNTADVYDLPFGRLQPGAPADMVLLSALDTWSVEHVVVDGVVDPTRDSTPPEGSAVATDTVSFDPVSAADLAIEHPGPGPVDVRVESAVGSFRTERATASVPVERTDPPDGATGVLAADPEADVLPMAVIERHGGPGTVGTGFVHNVGIERGAIGTTVAHDAHNCVVTGVTHDAMATVANHLRKVGGGLAVYDSSDETLTCLRLPVAGLISEKPVRETAAEFREVVDAADDIGLSVPGGVLELTYLALEVIPAYRLTDRGLVDVEAGEYVEVVCE